LLYYTIVNTSRYRTLERGPLIEFIMESTSIPYHILSIRPSRLNNRQTLSASHEWLTITAIVDFRPIVDLTRTRSWAEALVSGLHCHQSCWFFRPFNSCTYPYRYYFDMEECTACGPLGRTRHCIGESKDKELCISTFWGPKISLIGDVSGQQHLSVTFLAVRMSTTAAVRNALAAQKCMPTVASSNLLPCALLAI
jgi:hypothetical protein